MNKIVFLAIMLGLPYYSNAAEKEPMVKSLFCNQNFINEHTPYTKTKVIVLKTDDTAQIGQINNAGKPNLSNCNLANLYDTGTYKLSRPDKIIELTFGRNFADNEQGSYTSDNSNKIISITVQGDTYTRFQN